MSLPLDAIAIVGMSGRFPGAEDVNAFWNNLAGGRETITRFPEEETEFSMATAAARAKGATFVRARGILEGADLFDAEFFRIQPREAEIMDPQHRIFLECAWEAIESAGYNSETYPGLIGVYAGSSLSSYLLSNLNQTPEALAKFAGGYPVGDFSTMLGNERDYLPTRVAYKLNLRGPSMAIQTACSTSLVAVCQACTALQAYQCDMALAGGVSVTFPQKREYLYEEDGMISPDGVCRSFDAEAQGTVFSHGSGVVLLKRLADAEAAGDTVLAVIRGYALNNDGSEKIGFAAPGLHAQASVIASAQALADVDPASISYIEAHGTGTPLGDPIEVAALTKAFREGGSSGTGFCALGSAKTNVGHLDVAAGVTGLIKTILQLRHEFIPPLLHFRSPNPRIDFVGSPFFPADQPRSWPRAGAPRRAGVSSFGVGGTNAHVVIEEAPEVLLKAPARRSQLLLLSARSPAALQRMSERLAYHLEDQPGLDLADVSFTLAVGRKAFGYRRALVAASVAEAIRGLRESGTGIVSLPENPNRAATDLLAALSTAVDPAPLQALLGDLWVGGASPDWTVYFAAEKRRRVPLPTYPFERKRFWVEPASKMIEEIDGPAFEEEPAPAGDRRTPLLETLRDLVEELSGRMIEEDDTSFNELGFDSLLLTQVSQAVFTRFGVKVSFRQLLGDVSSLRILADHIDGKLPADAPTQQPVPGKPGSRLPVVRWPGTAGPALVASTRFGPYKSLQRESGDLTDHQRKALDDLIARYVRRTAGSKNCTAENRAHFADPRAVAGFHPLWKEMVYPIVADRSKGSTIWDIDGNAYVDLTMGFGTYFFGHSPDWLVSAVQAQLQKGIEIGPQSASAGAIARDICEFTGQERVTFCNTGSEAVMAALRLARLATGRTRVACFTGDYHGMFDEVLVRGSWVDGEYRAQPVAPGIPSSLVENMLVLDYGTPETLDILRRHAGELAAILVEPVQSRRPDWQPREFLQELRALATRSGAALIFDEVVTGFRCHPGGAQALFGVQADLATYGKVLGGGIPIGVVAGSRKFMDGLDGGDWKYGDDSGPETGMTFFAGTFVRHPLAMAAARAVLLHLREQGPGLQLRMTERTALLARTLNQNFTVAGVPLHMPHFSAVAGLEYAQELPHASLLWYYLREKGLHIWEGRPIYLTSAHTDADFDRVVSAFRDSVGEMQDAHFLPAAPAREALGMAAEFPRVDRSPTTEAQREIWTSASMGDDANRSFNEAITLTFTGPLDRPTLENSLLHIVQRHEALRSTFSADGMEQIFYPAPENVDLPITDLRALSAADRELRLAAECALCTAHVFDLTNGPLLLLRLIILEDQRLVLLVTAHHLVCDGWSLGMIVEELALSYNSGKACRLPMLPPPLPFGNYARALRGPQSENQKDRDYWISLFADGTPTLELPLDRPRPALKTYAGGMETLVVDAGRFARLQKASPRLGGTLFSTLLSVFATLLHRLSGQNDLVIGVPSAGQTLAGSRELIGHCLNFLPLRLRCEEGQAFRAFAEAASRVVIEAYEHQNYTFGSLVRELRLPRDASRLPLVSVMFNIDKSGFDRLSFDGLDFRVGTNAKQFVNFDLFFNLAQSDDRLEVECEYNTDLFDAATIQRWLASFESLIEGVLNDGASTLETLPVLSEAEKDMLAGWNATTCGCPGDRGVHELVASMAAALPDKTAVRCGSSSLSYRDLDQGANRLAAHLQSVGVASGDLVGLCAKRSPEMVVGLLGILKAGAAYVPMDPDFPAQRLGLMVEDTRMRVLVTERDLLDQLSPHHALTVLLDVPLAEPPADFAPVSVGGENPAYVIFTSGSTGRPKGVRIPHRALGNFLTSMRCEPGLTVDDTLLSVTTLSFDISGLEIFLPLTTGATVVLAARETVMDGYLLRDELAQSGATVMQATPATWRLLLEAGWRGDKNLKILIGGEAVPRELVNQLVPLCGSLWNLYGPTETTIWSTVARMESGNTPVRIGRPIDNTQVYVVNSALQLQPVGTPGELLIGGDGLALDYLNQPALTAERFIANPVSGAPSARVYRTGDLARWHSDGSLECLGRLDHQIKLRGYRIEPGEIESLLERSPGVAQAVVDIRDERLVAWLRLEKSALPAEGSTQWQDKWESIFQTAISQSGDSQLDHLDAVINSWTGVENAAEQVEEWISVTVARIREFHPVRVFEIGCGTGQLLSRLAPNTEVYWAADISQAAVEALQKTVTLPQVKLFQRPADDFAEIPDGFFDTVIINSVAQYFPGAEYLRRVLAGALRVLKPGGRVFLGDIQGFALLPVHHAETLLVREGGGMTCGQFREKLSHRLEREKELCLDPDWFELLELPGLAHREFFLRRGRLGNETTDYHYDVVLHAGPAPSLLAIPDWKTWDGPVAFENLLAGESRVLALKDIPDARLARQLGFYRAVRDLPAAADVPVPTHPPADAVSAEELFAAAVTLGYRAFVRWQGDGLSGLLEAVFLPSGNAARPLWPRVLTGHSPSGLASVPWQEKAGNEREVFDRLRRELAERLPDYMIPGMMVSVREFPLTPNGKIDRRALTVTICGEASTGGEAPETPREKELAVLWGEMLNISGIGRNDDFFELGGHSLFAFQLFAEIQKRHGISLPLASLFRAPTLRALAELLDRELSGEATAVRELESIIAPIQEEGHKPPFFCIHGGDGGVIFYRDLARHLQRDRPLLAVESPALSGEGEIKVESVEDMAVRYLQLLRRCQETGPYFLGGYSFGGLVAYEMACQLHQQGETVAFLALFDTICPTAPKRPYTLPERLVRNWNAETEFPKRVARVLRRAKNKVVPSPTPREVPSNGSGRAHELGKAHEALHEVYRPRPYPGKVTLFKALADDEIFKFPEDYGWARLAGEVEIVSIPGRHLTVFDSEHLPIFGAELRQRIEDLETA